MKQKRLKFDTDKEEEVELPELELVSIPCYYCGHLLEWLVGPALREFYTNRKGILYAHEGCKPVVNHEA